jgi:hypothetical protein
VHPAGPLKNINRELIEFIEGEVFSAKTEVNAIEAKITFAEETGPNRRVQPTPTRAPFESGTWCGRHLGRLAIPERG